MSDPTSTPANAVNAGKNGSRHYANFPVDAIEELLSNGVQSAVVRVQRRNQKGQLITVSGRFELTGDQLLNFESWVAERFGGGNFRVELKDPTNVMRVMLTFDCLIEGMPKVQNASIGNLPAGYPGNELTHTPGMPGQDPRMPTPGFLAHLSPLERAHIMAQVNGAPTAQFSSDEVLNRELTTHREELARIKVQREKELTDLAAKSAALQERLAKAESDAKEAAHRGELKALEAKLDAIKEVRAAPVEQKVNWMEIAAGLAPLATALAPLGAAFISSRSAETNAQLTMQQTMMQTMVAASQRPPDNTTERLLQTFMPMLTPLLGKAIESKGPEQQAALFQALADNNLNTVSMMAQLLESMAPPPESPGGAVVRQVLEGVKAMAQGYVLSQGGLPGQRPVQPSPIGTLREPSMYDAGEPEEAQHQEEAAPAPGIAPRRRRQIPPKPPTPEVEMLFGMLPSEFQTQEWRTILRAMHTTPPSPAAEVAGLLAGHIENLVHLGLLPKLLESLFEAPRETLEAMLEVLPVAAQHPQYAVQVLDLTLAMLREDGYGPNPALEGDEEEEPEEDETDEEAVDAQAEA